MTAKQGEKKPKGVLNGEIEKLMTPEAIKELGALTPTMQQFLLRWQDERDIILGDQLKVELKDFLFDVYQKDNTFLCSTVTEAVTKNLAEVLAPFYSTMETIATDIKDIKSDVLNIRNRLEVIECKVKEDESKIADIVARLEKKKLRIEILEERVRLLQPEPIEELITEVHAIRPTLTRLAKTQVWWNIGLRILLAVTISTIISLIIHYQIAIHLVK